MIPGYVYVLVNPCMPGLIKIGRTLRDSRTRARELSSTGVPMPFQVAFELFSEDHQKLEVMMHQALADFRVDAAREFFRYPLDKTIKLLLELSEPTPNPSTRYVAEDITQRLREKHPAYLRSDIAAIRIVQVPGRVWLEITTEEEIAGYLVNQTIKRTDLAFISDTDESFFHPEDGIRINASRLVDDYDAYSIIMTTDLFHDEACREIQLAYQATRTLI